MKDFIAQLGTQKETGIEPLIRLLASMGWEIAISENQDEIGFMLIGKPSKMMDEAVDWIKEEFDVISLEPRS